MNANKLFNYTIQLMETENNMRVLSELIPRIQDYRSKNKVTILLASHNMAEVERLCDSIIMMKNGKIIDRGTCKQIIDKHGRNNLEETFLKLARSKSEF